MCFTLLLLRTFVYVTIAADGYVAGPAAISRGASATDYILTYATTFGTFARRWSYASSDVFQLSS